MGILNAYVLTSGKEKLAEYLKISHDNAKAIMNSFLGIIFISSLFKGPGGSMS